jgi:hypothetical protein
VDVSLTRPQSLLARAPPLIALVAVCIGLFLLLFMFGFPPKARGLDPSWTDVQAWAFLNRAQWGRDLINTYGPLGFLHPTSAYVSGIFWPFVIGQIALTAAFVVTVALTFRRAPAWQFALFAIACLCAFYRLPGDVEWLLTLTLAAVHLLAGSDRMSDRQYLLAATLTAFAFAVIALIKFSAAPLWLAGVATITGTEPFARRWRRAAVVPPLFTMIFVAIWCACGQNAGNLPAFLKWGLEISQGYRHAAGWPADAGPQAAGLAVLALFLVVVLGCAWRARRDAAVAMAAALIAFVAVLFWTAFFTRGDEYHWPGFFVALSLLPFAALRLPTPALPRFARVVLVVLAAGCAAAGFTRFSPQNVGRHALTTLRDNGYFLGHLNDLARTREEQWRIEAAGAALPEIRERVGDARVDVVTWQQGILLANGLNYAPRPMFQSHLAFTPALARLNESYLLGPRAPPFVLFQLETSDDRLPLGEDALTMLALLRRYRPTLFENGFVLLERDVGVNDPAAIGPAPESASYRVGAEVPVERGTAPAVAYIDLELSTLGKLYTLFAAEPRLFISVRTTDGTVLRHRFVRLSATVGQLIDPLVLSTRDWLALYYGKKLRRPQTITIDTESHWQHFLFAQEFRFAMRPLDILHGESATAPASLRHALYPEFDIEPTAPADLNLIVEDGIEAVFLHAPATLRFERAALTTPGCMRADPDGVGISVALVHAGADRVLWHGMVDPFHNAGDRNPRRLRLRGVDVAAGDALEYRVDPGPAGSNTSCDWSYVRDVTIRADSGVRSGSDDESLFDGDFE